MVGLVRFFHREALAVRLHSIVLVSVAFQLPMWAQVAPSEAPVPTDPLELVIGSAQPITDAAERATLVSLRRVSL